MSAGLVGRLTGVARVLDTVVVFAVKPRQEQAELNFAKLEQGEAYAGMDVVAARFTAIGPPAADVTVAVTTTLEV